MSKDPVAFRKRFENEEGISFLASACVICPAGGTDFERVRIYVAPVDNGFTTYLDKKIDTCLTLAEAEALCDCLCSALGNNRNVLPT